MLGYDDDTYDEYSKIFEFDWDDYEETDEDITPDSKGIECPKCGHKFTL